jgi:lysophospholipase L1-like esterase
MLGDSLTAFAEWQELFPAARIANRGIQGDTVSGMFARLDAVLSLNPQRVLVLAGTNDLNGDNDVDAVYDRYVELLEAFAASDVATVIQSTLYTCGYSALNEKVADLNRRLREYAAASDLDYLDLNAVLAPGGELQQDLTVDGIHLTGPAYLLWRDAVEPWIPLRPSRLPAE